MNAWEVCTSTWVNVVLRLGSKGYPPHGHDVLVTACVKGSRKDLFLYDIEKLKNKLEFILGNLNYSDLAAVLGVKEASLEDLVLYVCNQLKKNIDDGLKVSLVEAKIPSGNIRLHC